MPPFTLTLLTAFSLVFVIEGLIYALFPDHIKKLMAMALSMPTQPLRIFGLLMASLGILAIYILKTFHTI
ncbi:MAG TPA: DUF2065 domain-containing protein [Alphaproteobacteria bacterium]|jgi:uncharacterized protein|nr:DUF2065 domain-containing protein [Micavibrio sp.]MBK9562655.1 DUF2065 domain-containing protein [Micavibrio sp.]HQX26356.1 DUF2065 domain-containing protein [Alphaproteobacteria bacterium]